MNSHKHARLTPIGRALLVQRGLEQGWTVIAASQAAGVSRRATAKWIARFQAEGLDGLLDRSSRPHRSPRAIRAGTRRRLAQLRRRRWPLCRIARDWGCSLATASRYMKRAGLSRLKSLEPAAEIVRYERQTPGELLH